MRLVTRLARASAAAALSILSAAALVVLCAPAVADEPCKVLDPELQVSYSGRCVDGLAEGLGVASGIAAYTGEFRAGRKHGKGTKTWANGDRYEGDFSDERIEGFGTYTFGRGPWAGESYTGDYLAGRRHGHGVYKWASGDLYNGPWREDLPVGPPTPMMRARAKHREEVRAAVAVQGQRVCREVPIGIGGRDWVRGTVVALNEEGQPAVRIDEIGESNPLASLGVKPGVFIWVTPEEWVPCY
jgi:hypothetical protein